MFCQGVTGWQFLLFINEHDFLNIFFKLRRLPSVLSVLLSFLFYLSPFYSFFVLNDEIAFKDLLSNPDQDFTW